MPKAGLIKQIIQNAKGFDAVLQKVNFLTANNGNSTAVLTVEHEHTNIMGGLHGGFTTTLVDVLSGMALFTHEHGERPGVTVSLNMIYLKGAKVGDEILIESKTSKVGKTLAFLEVEIRNNKSNDLLVKGEQIKALLG